MTTNEDAKKRMIRQSPRGICGTCGALNAMDMKCKFCGAVKEL